MTPEMLTYAMLLAAAGGIVIPAVALAEHRQLMRRQARQPAATEYENIEERLVERRKEEAELRDKLSDLADQLVRRDMAVAEAEEARIRLTGLQESLALMEPKRMELERLELDLASRQEAMADLAQRMVEAEAKVEEQARVLRRAEADAAAAEEKAAEAERRRGEAVANLEDLATRLREAEAALQEKQGDIRQADGQLADIRQRIAEGRDDLDRQRREQDAIKQTCDQIRAEITRLEQRKAELEAAKAHLEGYVEQARADREKDEKNALEDLKRAPACLSEAGLRADRGRVTENDALAGLRDYLDQLGLRFPARTLNAFHTCMKINGISPLTVLAGISGTGKSELPRRYAEGIGVHFLQMAVQPRWDSPQDLFGFYNYLEHRYVGTDLARALAHLDPHNHPDLAKEWRDRMLLVLLDEMNLARVEYYFSEFLSRLEVRKSADPANPAARQNAEVHLDVGGMNRAFNIYVDRNVLFVGTMNEDESTQTLSDKVIDRANVLRFGRPKQMAHEQPKSTIATPDRYLSRTTWNSWERDADSLDAHSRDKLRGWIEKLNDAMSKLDRPFGHRVNQAIQLYCANYPGGGPGSLGTAFGDQLEQRILPKLRGIDTMDFQDAFIEIESLARAIGDEALAEAVNTGRQKPLFTWQGLNRDS
ncbi:AAA family ATPase [Caenispirillum bisanense]|uniref:AAA domain (Dynein-related subfamily) n=1 Tax=Caenispirillum bisanense TaxID=414052 RepID=A0A286GCN2_9PROT|nr:AAA family ATPase [Caenispirillum bisanense]SOD93248.1 AAA domain (dynein-related subfamily) [Caenispirillum bisanense]